jgi:hypothetical protein
MKHNAIKGNAYLAFALVLAITTLTGCPGLFLDTGGTQSVDSSKLDLTYKALVERSYIGGSVIYALNSEDKTPALVNQLAKDVVISVRLGRTILEKNSVEYEDYMDSAIVIEDPNSPISYGYIKITEVNTELITFEYQRFSAAGGLPFGAESFTVRNGEAAVDINHDGAPDIAYGEQQVYHDGLAEESRHLNFISSNINLNTTMYSVDPRQYGGNYPGGLVGINPHGKWLVNMYEASEVVMLPGSERDTASGTLNKVQGLIKGDFVIKNSFQDGGYYYYTGDDDLDLSTPQPVSNLEKYLAPLGGYEVLALPSSAVGSSFGWGGNTRAAVGTGGVDLGQITGTASNAEMKAALGPIAKFTKADIPLFKTAAQTQRQEEAFKKFKIDLAALLARIQASTPARAAGSIDIAAGADIKDVIGALNAAIDANNTDALKVVENRGKLMEELREAGLDKYILAVNMDTGSVADALPIMAFELQEGFDYDYDPEFEWEGPGGGANAIPEELLPSDEMVPAGGVDPVGGALPNPSGNVPRSQAAAGYAPESRAVKDYTTYQSEQNSARTTFESAFKQVLEVNAAQMVVDKIKGKLGLSQAEVSVGNVVAQAALGLAGGGSKVDGHISLTVGAAVYLQMEIDLKVDLSVANLFGEDGIKVFEYSNNILIGAVLLTVEVPVYVNLDVSIRGSSNRTYFAGYTGFYGGKGTAGARYGVKKTSWGMPYGWYVDPYSSGESWSTTVAYAGPKSASIEPVIIDASVTVTPRVIVVPTLKAWEMIWVKLPVETQLPLGVAMRTNPFSWTLTGQLNFLLNMQAGVGFRILLWDVEKTIVDIRLATVNIPLFTLKGGAAAAQSPGFRSYHGKYASAQPNGTVVADRAAKGAWETWTLEDRGGGKVALKSAHGYYLCAENDSAGTVKANRNAVGEWETWTMTKLADNRVQLKSWNNKYLSADSAGKMSLAANANTWETWVSVQ